MSRKQQFANAKNGAASTGVMPMRRGPAGQHAVPRSRDKWEQQADDAAKRILRGEQNVARMLTPAPAASYRAAASVGEPLPSGLRQDLERGFGADLAAVRIHRDAAAAASARNEHALSFAAGRNIYFDQGRFDGSRPHYLLLHEVAHVLQQTARVSDGGSLRATDQSSTGDIQCVSSDIPDFIVLRKLHSSAAKGHPEDPKYAAVANELAKRVVAPDPQTALGQYFEASLATIGKKWPAEAESLFYDTLKRFGSFERAARLIERDNFAGGIRIQTAAWSGETVAALEARNHGPAVYVQAVDKHPALKFYAEELVRLVEVFLFQSTGTVPPMPRFHPRKGDSAQTIHDAVKELNANLDDNTELSSSEWVFQALATLDRLDQVRQIECEKIAKATAKAYDHLNSGEQIYRRQGYAAGVLDWGQKFLASTETVFADSTSAQRTADKAAWAPFLKKLGDRIADVGKRGLTLWEQTGAISSAVHAYFGNSKSDGEVQKKLDRHLLDAVRRIAVDSGLSDQLIHVLQQVDLPGAHQESPPQANEYRTRAAKLKNALETFAVEKLDQPQLTAFHGNKIDQAAGFLWLMLRVRGLVDELGRMAPSTDSSPAIASQDERVYKRIRLARDIRAIADPLGLAGVVEAADVILEAQNEKKGELAILPFDDGTYWKKDTNPRRHLQEITEVKGWEPLTGRHLEILFQITYYEELAVELQKLIPANEMEEQQAVQRHSQGSSLLAQAVDAVKDENLLPQRWDIRQGELALKKESHETLADLIVVHPSYSELLKQKPSDMTILFPVSSGIFAWFIPSLSKVAFTLHKVKLLNARVAASLPGNESAAQKLKRATAEADLVWLGQLLKQMEEATARGQHPTDKQRQDAEIEILHELEKLEEPSFDKLKQQIKIASRLNRRIIANEARPALKKYAESTARLTGDAEAALNLIVKFHSSIAVLDGQDILAEMTALMLDLAPDLYAALKGEKYFNIIHAYLGLLESAVSFADTLKAMPRDGDRSIFLAPSENSDEWIASRQKQLSEVTQHLQEVRAAQQQRERYTADAAQQSFRLPMAYSSAISTKDILYPRESLIDPLDRHYKILNINQSYVYHPPYGYAGEAVRDQKMTSTAVPSGYSPARFMDKDDKVALPPTDRLLDVQILDRDNNPVGEPRQLGTGPQDAQFHEEIYNALGWAGFASEAENINAGIGFAVNKLLDAAEFIPGVGQGIMIGRIVLVVDDFLEHGGLDDLKFIASGFSNITDGLLDRIKDAIEPENLINLLLFGSPLLEAILAHSTLGENKKPEKENESGYSKSGRSSIWDKFKHLGQFVFHALRKLHDWIEVPVDDVRSFVSTRPVLSSAMRFIEEHFMDIERWAESFFSYFAKTEDHEGLSEKGIKDMLVEQQAPFAEHIHDVLAHFERLELPDKVIDFEPIYESWLGYLEGVVDSELGVKARVVFGIAKTTGALDFANRKLSTYLIEKGADPNIIWRDTAVPLIADKFNDARDWAVDGINDALRLPVFGKAFEPVSNPGKMTLKTETGIFQDEDPPKGNIAAPAADTHPFPSDDRPLHASPSGVGHPGPGVPLEPRVRAGVESSFGQEFSHVRLHTGAESGRMTDAFGVDGLATGSHVYLRPGLSPQSGKGRQVLHHELAHVMQHTGDRPQGASVSSEPVPGHPERGLDYDPAKERSADQLAGMASRGQAPIRSGFGGGKEGGLQPAGLKPAIADLLGRFSDLKAIKAEGDFLQKAGKVEGKSDQQHLPPDILSFVDALMGTLKDITAAPGLDVPKVFKPALPRIQARFSDPTYADSIISAAYEIAAEALSPEEKSKGTQAPPPRTLRLTHFTRMLEQFILARTGIAVGLKLKQSKGGKGAPKPVQSVKILYIYLPYIDGRNLLWSDVIEGTWGSNVKDEDKIRANIRRKFAEEGIAIGVWPFTSKTFRFSDAFKAHVNELVALDLKGTALQPGQLTPPTEFALTDNKIPSPIGMRLGIYTDTTGAGRNLHHLTQYAMANYFANKHDIKAFKTGRDYPGVKFSGSDVDTISTSPGGEGSDAIKVARTESNRGGEMPTISLSQQTHLGSNLHLTHDPDDLPHQNTKVHVEWIDDRFKGRLDKNFFVSEENKYQAFLNSKSRATTAKIIYDAVQSTYSDVEDRMSSKLIRHMPLAELEYYRAQAKGTEHDLSDKSDPTKVTKRETLLLTGLQHASTEAKKYNKKQMSSLNWTIQ